jgi:hypothetical protein
MKQQFPPFSLIGALIAVLALGCAGSSPEIPPPVQEPVGGEIEHTLYLIGDGGAPAEGGEPVLLALTAVMQSRSTPSTVVFLGDNIYRRGLPDTADSDRAEMERRINAQVDAVLATSARGIFIPGGCPGPVVVDLGESIRLVVLDTQWWLHNKEKPQTAEDGCDPYTREGVVDSLAAALAGSGSRHVVIAGHHPLDSSGPHGGHFTWEQHIFPLTEAVSWLYLPIPDFQEVGDLRPG